VFGEGGKKASLCAMPVGFQRYLDMQQMFELLVLKSIRAFC